MTCITVYDLQLSSKVTLGFESQCCGNPISQRQILELNKHE